MTLPSDISDLETIIFGAVSKQVQETSEALGLVVTVDLSGKATDFIRIPKTFGSSVPPTVAEGTPISPRKFLMDLKDVRLTQRWGDSFALARDAILDSEVSLMELGTQDLAQGFTQVLDEYLFGVLLRKALQSEIIAGDVAHHVYSLGSNPVVEIVTIEDDSHNALTAEGIDQFTGKVQIAEDLSGGDHLNIVYYSSDHKLVQNAKTPKELSYEDIVGAYGLARNKYETMKTICVNPRSYQDLLKSPVVMGIFIAAAGNSPAITGEMSRISGMRIIMTTRIPEGVCLLLDEKRFVTHVQKGTVSVKSRDELSSDSVEIYAFMRAGADVLWQYSASLIVNLGSLSATL